MRSKSLITLNEPMSYVAESYKMFRTNLGYMNLDNKNKVLMMTSSTSSEGKTTSTVNLAISFAQEGKKTLIVECDLRIARVHKLLKLHQSPGLTSYLSGKTAFERCTQQLPEVDNLDVITSGVLPPSPSDIFGTASFEAFLDAARERYEVIILDTPPVLHVSDAAILSKYADGVVLVVALKESKKESVIESTKALQTVGANMLGVLLTKDKLGKSEYRYSYGNTKKKKRLFG